MGSTAVPKPAPAATSRHDAEDLISGLPDELLHAILVRLPCAASAARTSVLSRRWRGVWAHMPELVLRGSAAPSTPSSAVLDIIDGALGSYAAPTLHGLEIAVRGFDRRDVHADRIAPLLSFASQRLAGKLRISLFGYNSYGLSNPDEVEEELALPVCERATEMVLDFRLNLFRKKFVLRPPPQTAGSFFSALTDLGIACAQMDGGELGRLVSSPQCPRLRKLVVNVSKLVPVSYVSIRSESLECLINHGFSQRLAGKLDVTAPMLREIDLIPPAEACIVAPKLEKIHWHGAYDPGRHQIAVASRHLRSLAINHWSGPSGPHFSNLSTRLMKRFDTATKMAICLQLLDMDIAEYVTFRKEMTSFLHVKPLLLN